MDLSANSLDNLYHDYIKAKHKYMSALRGIKIPEFLDETQDYVWDVDHPYYRLFFTSIKSCPSQQHSQEIKDLYKKLALLVHPDKCKADWAERIFNLITIAYNNGSIDQLQELDQYYNKEESFDGFSLPSSSSSSCPDQEKEELKVWENQVWFLWQDPKSFVRKVLVPPHKLVRRQKKRSGHSLQ